MNFKKLSLGLVAATMLVALLRWLKASIRNPARRAFTHPNSRYLTAGYGVRAAPRPGYYPRYYSGNRFQPAPRVGAFATAPWDDGSYGSYGLVERQW